MTASKRQRLRIDELPVPGTPGVLGLTLCPGKRQPVAHSGSWERDLDDDLRQIAAWGASAIVNLVEDHEMRALDVADTAERVPPGIRYYRLPITDAGIPDARWERNWSENGAEVRAALMRGERILVHCKGGLGRTGLFAARVLIEFGTNPAEAVRQVRAARPGSIETRAQHAYVLRQQCVDLVSIGAGVLANAGLQESASRFRGCLLGGAVGDALGAPVEFLRRQEILQRFGPDGIAQFSAAYGGLGKITDDTQMTLFTAEGLLRGWVRSRLTGAASYADVTANAYLRWLHTQGERPAKTADSTNIDSGWLFQQRGLHSARAPGKTCLSALRAIRTPGEPARNRSKGCGGVMRVAPVGLFAARLSDQQSVDGTFQLGSELAALTHGHPTGALPAGVLAVLVRALVEGGSLADGLLTAKVCLCRMPDHEETLSAVAMAEHLATTDMRRDKAIASLGGGWIAEEALAISIYCALVARDFREGVILAVNHDGDSDSTGSIVGNLLGTLHGEAAIPAEWLEPLELREVIAEVANDLHAFPCWEIEQDAKGQILPERILRKYPGC